MDLSEIDEFKIVLPKVGQKNLRQAGPMIPASWMVPPEREQQLRLLGKPIPPPISGYLLLDTGAGHVSIDIEVARELNIMPMAKKKTEVHGFGGAGELNHYFATLVLPTTPMKQGKPIDEIVAFRTPVEAWAGEGTRASHLKWGYEAPDGTPLQVIGVLGRIILQFTKFIYNGLTGEVEIYIDKSIMFPKRD